MFREIWQACAEQNSASLIGIEQVQFRVRWWHWHWFLHGLGFFIDLWVKNPLFKNTFQPDATVHNNAPPQLDPAPAVHPKQWLEVAMCRPTKWLKVSKSQTVGRCPPMPISSI